MKEDWINIGYKNFAIGGPNALKVEQLAKQVKKNKSSFYHYFSDLEVFTEKLLDYHLTQAKVIAKKEEACTSQDELIDILVYHKIDLLFNRQLRVHRENPQYRLCFEKASGISAPPLLKIWQKMLNLDEHPHLANLILRLGIENFYLQITEETLTPAWLNTYFSDFKRLVSEFMKARHFTPLDGGV